MDTTSFGLVLFLTRSLRRRRVLRSAVAVGSRLNEGRLSKD